MSDSAAPPPDAASYPRDRVTGGILAGGRATRMGGQDKGLVALAGRPMVEYVLAALRAQAAKVVINANRSFEEYGRYGVPVVRDLDEGFLGPLAGMASMMQATDTEWLLTAPCDSPEVRRDYGARLWAAAARAGADVAVANSGDRLEPVFALLRCSLAPAIDAYLRSGERRIRWFYQSRKMVEVDFSDCPEMFVNVNSPVERDELAAKLASGPAR